MDWKMKSILHFESVNEITPKYKTFPSSMLDPEHDSTHEELVNTCINSSVKEILGVMKDPNISSLCSWEQEHSYKQQKKEMHYLCMPF
jgi:hypothetical protein